MSNEEILRRSALAGHATIGSLAWDSMMERERSAKVIDLAAARVRLRPPAPGSLTSALAAIEKLTR